MSLISTIVPSGFVCSLYVIRTHSPLVYKNFLLCSCSWLCLFSNVRLFFLRGYLKELFLYHSILPNSIGSEIQMIQAIFSETIVVSMNHCIRIFLLSKKK